MSDDDFGRRLRDGIPEPRAGYWEDIHASLGQIAELTSPPCMLRTVMG